MSQQTIWTTGKVPPALKPAFEALNLLGPAYWGDTGLKNRQVAGDFTGFHRALIEAVTSGKARVVISGRLPEAEEASISTPYDYNGSEGDEPEDEDDAKVAKEFDRLCLEDATVQYSPAFVEELATREIPTQEVTLRLPPFSWSFKPPQWYNMPPNAGDAFPRLSSRKYIKIDCPSKRSPFWPRRRARH